MTNDEKDRHVLAAAIRGGCESIITFNTRHFPAQATDPFNIAVVHPDEFLIDLYYLDPDRVVHVLHEQGSDLNPTKSFEDILRLLRPSCPRFVQLLCAKLEVEI